ncbi:hypothetical protein ACSW8L_15440 (plasmid) [Clostridium perfringens]
MKCDLCKEEMVSCDLTTENGERIGIATNRGNKIYLGVYICENCGLMKVDLDNYGRVYDE